MLHCSSCPLSRPAPAVCSSSFVSKFCRHAVVPTFADLRFASSQDVPFLIKEIFEDRAYLQHGICLSPGKVVIDVGANVGLFALQAAGIVGEQGHVICLEPNPAAYDALLFNLAQFSKSVNEGSAAFTPIQAAAGPSNGATNLTIYHQSSGWSTTQPNNEEVQQGMRAFLNNALPGMRGIKSSLVSHAARLLRLLTPKVLHEAAWRLYISSMLSHRTVVECRQVTLSQVISDLQLPVVDLLKVDVERAELEVLAGIQPQDWPSIRQVVLEVHDSVGRLEQIEKLLQQQGFHDIRTAQAPDLQGSNLFMVYCRRHS